MKPEEGVNIKNTTINGSWTIAVATASPPNPRGLRLVSPLIQAFIRSWFIYNVRNGPDTAAEARISCR
jgi:hypothetical protein